MVQNRTYEVPNKLDICFSIVIVKERQQHTFLYMGCRSVKHGWYGLEVKPLDKIVQLSNLHNELYRVLFINHGDLCHNSAYPKDPSCHPCNYTSHS